VLWLQLALDLVWKTVFGGKDRTCQFGKDRPVCLSNNTSSFVQFDDTILYGAVVPNPAGDIEHILAYYNKVSVGQGKSVAEDHDPGAHHAAVQQQATLLGGAARQKGNNGDGRGNAMLFAVPAIPATMSAKNLIPVAAIPQFMKDYKLAISPRLRGGENFFLSLDSPAPGAVVVKGFDDGIYDVVIASSGARTIPSVLDQVDAAKRPVVNQWLYAELDIAYPNFTFVLFCFSESRGAQAGCAMMRYTPMDPDQLYLPGLDGHQGFIERGEVSLFHTLVVGVPNMKAAQRVAFSDRALQHKRPYYLLDQAIGRVIPPLPVPMRVPQGDFLFDVNDIQEGRFRCSRRVPPGWMSLPDTEAPAATPFLIGN